jgi:beta-1,4-mannosyltransferase
MSDQQPLLQVLMMPDYRRDNPYQALLAEAIESHHVKVTFPDGYRRGLPILRAILASPQPIDVLHLHWFDPYVKGTDWITKLFYALKFLLDLFWVRWIGVKIVWTVHNQVEHDTPFPRLEQWVQKRLVKMAHHVILLNQSTLADPNAPYYGSPAKSVISHGHYRPVYAQSIAAAEARKILGLPLHGRVYLNFGVLRPYKGIESLLEVWQASQVDLADCTLVIAGQPNDVAYGQHLMTMMAKIKNVIFYSGFVESEKVHLFFSAADVVVLPYCKILNSGSTILAMSFGKPIIAPHMGSLPEILGDAGQLLYNAANAQGLSGALQKSFDCDLVRLSQLTVEACDRLDWDAIGRKTVQVYQGLHSQFPVAVVSTPKNP